MKAILVVVAVMVALSCDVHAQMKILRARDDASAMTYRLVHPLHKVEATSTRLDFALKADPQAHAIAAVSAQVDVTTFDSGNSNRDSHAMEVIEAIRYPTANFSSTRITQEGDSLIVQGKLTFHGVTRDITARALEHWSPGLLSVEGSMELSLTAFNIERPSLMLIPVSDDLTITFKTSFALI